MPHKAMTDAHRIAFETNGFGGGENALTPGELDAVRGDVALAEQQWDANPTLPGFRKPALCELIGPINYGPAMRDLLWHPKTFPSLEV